MLYLYNLYNKELRNKHMHIQLEDLMKEFNML